jgi:hypothetical protein
MAPVARRIVPDACRVSLFLWAGSGPSTDVTFDLGTHGPVLVDQSNGHTYRVIATNGVVGTVLVT